MDLNDFIAKFSEQFYETEPEAIKADTQFKELEEWSSLKVILIIAMIDDVYGVTIDGSTINQAETIQDLFNTVAAQKK